MSTPEASKVSHYYKEPVKVICCPLILRWYRHGVLLFGILNLFEYVRLRIQNKNSELKMLVLPIANRQRLRMMYAAIDGVM